MRFSEIMYAPEGENRQRVTVSTGADASISAYPGQRHGFEPIIEADLERRPDPIRSGTIAARITQAKSDQRPSCSGSRTAGRRFECAR